MFQLFEKSSGTTDINRRIRGFSPRFMASAPGIVAWHTTKAAAQPDPQRRYSTAWNTALTFVQSREAFGGEPGILGTARNRLLDIDDATVRSQGLGVLDALQALPLQQQQQALAFLRGQRLNSATGLPAIAQTTATQQATEAAQQTVEGLFLDEAVQAGETGQLSLTPESQNYKMYAALKTLFPDLDLQIEDEALADQLLIDISDAAADAVMQSSSARSLVGRLDEVAKAEGGVLGRAKEGARQFLPTVLDLTGLIADTNLLAAGKAAETTDFTARVADEVRGNWRDTEERMAETLAGHWEEVNGKAVWNAGPLSFGLDPNSADFQHQIETRLGGLTLLGGAGAALGATTVGTVARRLKVTRSVAGNIDAVRAVQAATRDTRYASRSGVLGAAAEVYRGPARLLAELTDDQLLRFRRSPEQFFTGLVNGRQGKKLMGVLEEAKKASPGQGQEALDAQVGFVNAVYGDQVPTDLVRNMLLAESDSAAKGIFVEMVTRPGGASTIAATQKTIDDINVKLSKLTTSDAPDLNELSTLRLRKEALEQKLATTFSNAPLLRYPTKSTLRAAVRQPTNRLERVLSTVSGFQRAGSWHDLAKTVNELPDRPTLHVVGAPDSPPDALDQNIHTISNVMRTAGVDAKTIQQRVGALSRITDPQEFFDLVERTIWGDGGDIDRAISRGRFAVTPEIRERLVRLHQSRGDNTLSKRTTYDTGPDGSTSPTNRLVLGKRNPGGEDTPLPSRDTEYLREVTLPSVEMLIDATSTFKKLDGIIRSNKLGQAALAPFHGLYWALFTLPRKVMKPLVLSTRPVALATRIQMEQALRASQFGFSPFKAMPEGWALLPGGVPIPFTDGKRMLGNVFGDNGWNLLGPDPSGVNGVMRTPQAAELGMWLEHNTEDTATLRVASSTQDIKNRPRTIDNRHLEAGRNELGAAFASNIDRKLAQFYFSRDKMLAWLKSDPWAKDFMESKHNDMLRRSSLYNDTPPAEPKIVTGTKRKVEPDVNAEQLGPRPTAGDAEGYVYHIGPPDALDSYRATGIEARQSFPDISEKLLPADHPMRRGRAFYADSLDQAIDYAQTGGEQFVVLRAKGSDVGDTTPEALFPGSQFSYDNLPPERIEFLGADDQWHPLLGTDPLERATTAWIDNRIEYLRQLTGGDDDLRKFVASGRLRDGRGNARRNVDATGKDLDLTRGVLEDELAAINDALRDVPEGAHIALQHQRRDVQRQLDDLDEIHPGAAPKYVDAEDVKGFNTILKEKWQSDPKVIPPRLSVRTKWDSSLDSGGRKADYGTLAAVSNQLYRPLKILTWADMKLTRGSVFGQSRSRFYDELIVRGYPEADAKAIAHFKATSQTRDIMYDLTNRTSFQRALKDLYWFAPAMQELLYTWMVKIPSQSYWPIGIAALGLKRAALSPIFKTLDNMPVVGQMIEKDEEGKYQISLSVIGRLMEGDIAGLNVITGGKSESLPGWLPFNPLPQMGTGGNILLSEASMRFNGPVDQLSKLMQPFGRENYLFPRHLSYAWEALTGKAPFWEKAYGGYAERQWGKAIDYGVRQAFTEMYREGLKLPRKDEFMSFNAETGLWEGDVDGYKEAYSAWIDELNDRGINKAQGNMALMAASTIISPMSLSTTTAEQKMWNKFTADLYGDDTNPSDPLTEWQREQIESWVSDHPEASVYAASIYGYGEPQEDFPEETDEDLQFEQDLRSERRKVLSPEEYIKSVVYYDSLRYYDQQTKEAMRSVSPTNDPFELLTNWEAASAATDQQRRDWRHFLALHEDIDTFRREQKLLRAEANGEAETMNYNAVRISEAIGLMKDIAPMLNGEEAMRPQEVTAVMGQLSALRSEYGEFGKAETETDKAIDWWFGEVLDPYLDKTSKLYTEADKLRSYGLDPSPIYEEIRQLNNESSQTYKGRSAPTPEEFFFGNRSRKEQQVSLNTWASRPVAWLSDFQREQVGYNVTPEGNKFLEDLTDFDRQFFDFIEQQDISSSSREYDALQVWRDQKLASMANEAGGDAPRLLELNEAAPYQRLNEMGFGQNVSSWGEVGSAAEYVTQQLEAEGLSPKGFSQEALVLKSWLYTSLENARNENDDLDKALDRLSYSYPLSGGGWRQGTVLYEALFFGNFNERYIPEELALLGGP